MNNESKALELAKQLRNGWAKELRTDGADVIERQHAEIESLRAQLEHLKATASSNYSRGHADAHAMLSAAPSQQSDHTEDVLGMVQQAPVAQGEPAAGVNV